MVDLITSLLLLLLKCKQTLKTLSHLLSKQFFTKKGDRGQVGISIENELFWTGVFKAPTCLVSNLTFR